MAWKSEILNFGELVLEGKLILRAPLQDSELSISETFISAVYSIKRVENQCDVEESREESKTEISRFGSLDRYKGIPNDWDIVILLRISL